MEVGTGIVNGLLLLTIMLAQQACGGSESPPATKPDASVDGKDAALDRAIDLAIDTRVDSLIVIDGELRLDAISNDVDTARAFDVGLDSTILPPPDTAKETAADGAVPIDVLAQDAGAVMPPDAQDAIPTMIDTGEDLAPVIADTMVESPDSMVDSIAQVDLSEVATVDVASDTSMASFSCVGRDTPAAGVLQQLCYDFTNASSGADFSVEAGTWTVADGTYNSNDIPSRDPCNGNGTVMSASVLRNLSAQDVRVHAKLTSVAGPDKVVVLRARSGGNRLELNFRAKFTDEGVVQGGDLSIFDITNCSVKTYADGSTILIPHEIEQSIVVDITLIGSQLTVVVDGKQVFNQALSGVSMTAGSVGFASFRDAETKFDDLLVEVLK
jgi:hypothetical protein